MEPTQKVYTDKEIGILLDLYTELGLDYQGFSPEQLEKNLQNVDPQWLDEIQLSEEWLKKHV